MSSILGTIAVRLAAHTAEFNRDVEKAAVKLDAISKAAGTVAKISGVAFAGMSAAIGLAIKASSSQKESMQQLANAFRATGRAVPTDRIAALASQLQTMTKFEDDASVAAATVLVRMGQSERAVMTLLPAIQDLSTAMGSDLGTAARAVGLALQGQEALLTRMIGPLSEAQRAILDTGTASERLALTMQLLSRFHGAAGIAASTSAGRAIVLKNAIGELTEEIGGMLDAPFAAGAELMTTHVQALTRAVGNLPLGLKAVAGAGMIAASGIAGMALAIGGAVFMLPNFIKGIEILKVSLLPGLAREMRAVMLLFKPGMLNIAEWKVMASATLPKLIAGFKALTLTIAPMVALLAAAVGMIRFYKEVSEVGFEGVVDRYRKEGALPATGPAGFGQVSGAMIKDVLGKGFMLDIMGDLFAEAQPAADGFASDVSAASLEVDGLGRAAKDAADEFDFGGGESDLDATSKMLNDAIADTTNWAEWGDTGDLPKDTADAISEVMNQEGLAAPFTATTGRGVSVSTTGGTDMSDPLAVAALNDEMDNLRWNTKSVGDAFRSAAGTIIARSGEIGGVMQSAAQGFSQGGPWGAVAAVAADLLSRTQAFNDTATAANGAIGELVAAFEPLAEAMKPLAGLTHNVIGIVADQLGPAFEAIAPVFGWLFEITKYITMGWFKMIAAIGGWWNSVVGGLEKLLDALPGVDVDFGRLKINLNGINRSIEELEGTTQNSTAADIAAAAAQDDASGATSDVADEMRELRGEMSNIPTGFKIDLRRYQATQGESLTPDVNGGGKGGVTFNVYALDLERAAHQLETIESFRQLTRGGRVPHRSPFAVPRGGG